jgi:acyl-CoA synthetase (AMP-forming)/AMP-acid ligase II
MPLPFGETGQVRYRTATVPDAYLNNPGQSKKTFKHGWFYPGDIAIMNEQGYLFLKGRTDDVISKFGSKFYPSEIETALLKHDNIKEAAVFGVDHKIFGQVPAAYIVTDKALTHEEITKFCQQYLAMDRIPSYFVIIKSLPKNPMGKVMKYQLEKDLLKILEKIPNKK